jgi:hypothetical protein
MSALDSRPPASAPLYLVDFSIGDYPRCTMLSTGIHASSHQDSHQTPGGFRLPERGLYIRANCIFCGVVLRPSRLQGKDSRTKEHVYGRWLRDVVKQSNFRLFKAREGEQPVLCRELHLESFINGSVCKQCNEGWMSDLESRIYPIIDKLTLGTNIRTLSTGEFETMARWAAKTAIVLSGIMVEPMTVPESIRRSLVPDSGPPQIRCFYAQFKTELTLETAFYQLRYPVETPSHREETAEGLRFTLCVYRHLVTVDFPPTIKGVR